MLVTYLPPQTILGLLCEQRAAVGFGTPPAICSAAFTDGKGWLQEVSSTSGVTAKHVCDITLPYGSYHVYNVVCLFVVMFGITLFLLFIVFFSLVHANLAFHFLRQLPPEPGAAIAARWIASRIGEAYHRSTYVLASSLALLVSAHPGPTISMTVPTTPFPCAEKCPFPCAEKCPFPAFLLLLYPFSIGRPRNPPFCRHLAFPFLFFTPPNRVKEFRLLHCHVSCPFSSPLSFFVIALFSSSCDGICFVFWAPY